MKTVVITGSTRGIGFGLAKSFLSKGCAVMVSGRSDQGVQTAVEYLQSEFPKGRIAGCACDVTEVEALENLWNTAKSTLGSVDIWINNAGIGHPELDAWDVPEGTVRKVIDVDLLGLVFGTQVAIRGMREQGSGQVYNMEGFGSDGRIRKGMSVYGAAKCAVRYYTKALIKETKDTPIKVGTLSPGIVITDFITDMYRDDPNGFEKSKKVYNILGDTVDTVTPWLADKVLGNDRSGASFQWLTTGKVLKRFLTAGFNKRDLFALEMNPK